VLTTILGSFIEAASGSPMGAAVFWICLFSAAMANAPESTETAESHRRWM
jgi:hypothetical protein